MCIYCFIKIDPSDEHYSKTIFVTKGTQKMDISEKNLIPVFTYHLWVSKYIVIFSRLRTYKNV